MKLRLIVEIRCKRPKDETDRRNVNLLRPVECVKISHTNTNFTSILRREREGENERQRKRKKDGERGADRERETRKMKKKKGYKKIRKIRKKNTDKE